MFRNLRTDLCGITIDSLTAGDDQIIFHILERTCNRAGSRPGIGTAKYTVRDQQCIIRTHCQRFPQNGICLRKTHGEYCDLNVFRIRILDAKCRFKACLVIRIHDRKHCLTIQCSVRFEFDAAGSIRNLLNANYNFHSF